jgi:hypothetical protein
MGFPAVGKPVLIAGPETPLHEHLAALKTLRTTGTHEDFVRVELWQSGSGITRTVKLSASSKGRGKKPYPLKKNSTRAAASRGSLPPVQSSSPEACAPPESAPGGEENEDGPVLNPPPVS